jgi:hypothetical protein
MYWLLHSFEFQMTFLYVNICILGLGFQLF